MFEPSKSYSIGVWTMELYVVDCDTGEIVLNKDGSVKTFYVPNYDYSYLTDGIDIDELLETTDA